MARRGHAAVSRAVAEGHVPLAARTARRDGGPSTAVEEQGGAVAAAERVYCPIQRGRLNSSPNRINGPLISLVSLSKCTSCGVR